MTYENLVPIDDELVVLDLLYTDRWEYKTDRRLYQRHPNRHEGFGSQSYVRVNAYSVRDYLVADHLGPAMLSKYMVEGKKHWGYTDDRDLTITEHGRTIMRDAYERAGVPFDDRFSNRLRYERWLREAKGA